MWHEWQTGDVHSDLAGRHEGNNHIEDLGVDSTLKWIFKKCDGGGMDWICLAEDRDN
jgi:hypothetical protein